MYSFLKNINIVFVTILIVISHFGCTKGFDELNTPKERIDVKSIDVNLLGKAFAESQYVGMYGEAYVWQQAQNLFSDLYSQYFATSADYFDSDQFVEVRSWSGLAWDRFYRDAAPQIHFVETFTKENNMVLENAVAKIWKVQLYHRLTDYWGPIIYSQFGNGKTSVNYDSQEVVYNDFFKILDEAIAVLKQNSGGKVFASSDLLYGGDVKKWLAFANSLRLRLSLRIVYKDPILAKSNAEKAVNDGVIINNLDNAAVLTNINALNPLAQVYTWGEFRMSAAIQSVLTGYRDPRVAVYFDEAKDGGYKGIRNGLPRVERGGGLTTYSNIGNRWHDIQSGGQNPPLPVMNAAEVAFLRAEGALRGWNMGGTANDFYNEGIRLSMSEMTNTSTAEMEEYIISTNMPVPVEDKWNTPALSNIPVLYQQSGSFETQLEQIITQKWIAIFPNGWEAWAERRRTYYPKLYPLIESINPDISKDEIMRRIPFAEGEYKNNLEAVTAAQSLLGGSDNGLTKLWWDAKP